MMDAQDNDNIGLISSSASALSDDQEQPLNQLDRKNDEHHELQRKQFNLQVDSYRPQESTLHESKQNVIKRQMHNVYSRDYVRSNLNILYTAIENPYIIDEMMATERNYDTFCFGFFTFVARWISLFKLNIDRNLEWSEILIQQQKTFKEEYKKIIVRVLFFVVVLGISVPYAYWISLVPNLLGGDGYTNPIFNIFMTLINSVPFLCCVTYTISVVLSINKITNEKIKIFSLCYRLHDLKNEEYTFKIAQEDDNDNVDVGGLEILSMSECDTLEGLVAEMHSLHKLGKEKVNKMYNRRFTKWKRNMLIASVWIVTLCTIYSVWIGRYVLRVTCNAEEAGVCATFLLLLLSSVVRFSIPLFIVFMFAHESDIVTKKIDIWYNMHNGVVDTAIVCALLKHNIKMRKYFANSWQNVFLVMFIIPVGGMLAIFAATLKDRTIIDNEWFFWVYCVHYSAVALFVFFKASTISANSFDIRTDLLGNTAIGRVSFINEKEQTDNYKQYLEKCYGGFEIFGFSITKSKLSSISALLITIISWMIDNVARAS